MAIGRGAFAALLKPDLYRVYVETGKERPLEYPLFFNVDDMPWNPVKDQQIAGLGTLLSMPEGENFPLDEPRLGGTVQYEAAPFGLEVFAVIEDRLGAPELKAAEAIEVKRRGIDEAPRPLRAPASAGGCAPTITSTSSAASKIHRPTNPSR